MRIAAVLTACLCLAAAAQADEFRYEVDGGYLSDDADFADSDTLRLGARYYFQPIADDDGPLAEAAFLRPASNIGLAFRDIDRSVAPPMLIADGPVFSLDRPYNILSPPLNIANIGGVLAAPFPAFGSTVLAGPGPSIDTQSVDARYEYVSPTRWLASVQIGREDGDAQAGLSSTDIEDTTYALEVGKYINPTTSVSLGFRYTNAEQTLSAPIFRCSGFLVCTSEPGPELISTNRQREWRARARHLRPVGEMHVAVRAEARYGVAELSSDAAVAPGGPVPVPVLLPLPLPRLDSYGVSLAGTLYPRANLGIGLDFGYEDVEGVSSNSTTLSVQWFVSRSVALSARLGRVNADRGGFVDGDTDSLGVGVLGRF